MAQPHYELNDEPGSANAASGPLPWLPIAAPYFGFVAGPPNVNNYGFHSPITFPYHRSKTEFVIAVFGGSVAEHLSQILGERDFQDRFRQLYQRIGDRKIVVLNFALGCFKQPQQFITASYFADSYDLSFNVDGYNEIGMLAQGRPVEDPCWMEPLYLNQAQAALMRDEVKARRAWQSAVTRTILAVPWAARSATIFLAWRAYSEWNKRAIRELNESALRGRKDELPAGHDGYDPIDAGAENWAKYARLQAAVAKASGKDSIFFLQPNLKDRGSKPLAVDERALLDRLRDRDKTVSDISRGYAHMRLSIKALAHDGIRVVDLSGIFGDNKEQLYIDDCCHLNRRGNELLAAAILKSISARSQR